MHQTKLIQILKSFDKTEVKQFEDFLESPFFNKSEKALNFYRILIAYYPGFDSAKLEKEKVYKKLHSKSTYNDQMMKEITSSLLKLAKEFIAHSQLKKKPFEASNFRYEWLNERGVLKMSKQELDHYNVMLQNCEIRDDNYYYHRWLADYHDFSQQVLTMRDFEYKLKIENGLDHHLHSLNKSYLLRFLESYIYLMSLAKIYNKEMDMSMAAHIESLMSRYIGVDDQLMDIYYNVYQLLITGAEKYFFELKAILLKNDASVPWQIKREVSINLENYCTQKLKNGDQKFGSEIMEIYHFEVEQDLMIENGEIPYSCYQNIMTIALDKGEMEWAKAFAEKYKPMLPTQYGDGVYNYCQASILFVNKKYDEALRILMQLGLSNNFIKIDIKNFTARIHYELGMFDQLEILLKSYGYNLKQETVDLKRKENHTLFATMMNLMMNLALQYSAGSWQELSDMIRQSPAFTHKPWFEAKMAEMKKKHISG